MLVLTRKRGEWIRIEAGDEVIEVTVVYCDGGKVRIGVQASPLVRIVRAELLDEETKE